MHSELYVSVLSGQEPMDSVHHYEGMDITLVMEIQ